MTSSIRVPLILLTLILQYGRVANGYCTEAVTSVVRVASCPTTKEAWNIAANSKNCGIPAAQQTCSDADKFVYHCVINEFQNETLEVCAPRKLIQGYCTEFNVAGGVIQIHYGAQCNKKTVIKCDEVYQSTEAYKFQGCYELVYSKKKTNISTNTTSKPYIPENKSTAKLVAAVTTVLLVLCIVGVSGYLIRKRLKARRGERTTNNEEQDVLIQTTEPSKNMTVMDEIKENKPPLRKDVEGADRYTMANIKTDDEYCEENREDSNRYLKCYQKMDKYFVETKTYQTAEKMFETNGIIIFTGPPGCGKTMAAIHLLGKKGQDRTFRKIRVLEELSYIEKDKKSLILIDNIFFRRPMDLQLEKWWDKLDEIYDKYYAGSENEMGTNNLRIVITARPNVIDRACEFMEKVTPILNKRFIIDTNKLTKAEKGQILAKQIEFARIEKRILVPDFKDAFKDEVMNSEGPIGFPLCAHLYVFGEDYQKSGIQFFSCPIEYLILQIKDEIESDKTNRTKSLLFSLFFHEWHTKMGNADSFDIQNEGLCELCLRNVSPNILAHFSPFDFRELESEAQRLTGTFFKEVGEHSYKFLHDSVYEAMAAYLCETYVSETAKYFPLDIIQNQDYKKMTKRQRSTLATRLLYETLDQRLSDVFSCKIFQNREFMDCFCDEIMKRDRETIFRIFTVPNNASAARLPCMFWASCNNLTHLTERFYDIIQEREINAEYQLYVALYGLCCARNRGLLKTINGMLCDNNEQIKKHVKDFKDSSENSILHLLLLSDFTDEFVANSVKILLEANMPVNVKNNEKVTPLMLAVEQVLPRMKVIKNLIDVPAKPMLHNQDNTVSTVFHHCLGSNNDDKTCVKCLKIILEGKDAKDCLSKNDINGDTALSIAARCSEHSRIVSIFKLLESDLNIINTLNEEGYSPLHLAVKSLKDTKITAELECCVRVIIFILYGDNPDKMSDADKKAVQECHYGLVQNILQNPKDEKNMKKALETILSKLQCTQCTDISEEKLKKIKEFIPSYKICSEIQACIAKAVFHFEHQF